VKKGGNGWTLIRGTPTSGTKLAKKGGSRTGLAKSRCQSSVQEKKEWEKKKKGKGRDHSTRRNNSVKSEREEEGVQHSRKKGKNNVGVVKEKKENSSRGRKK